MRPAASLTWPWSRPTATSHIARSAARSRRRPRPTARTHSSRRLRPAAPGDVVVGEPSTLADGTVVVPIAAPLPVGSSNAASAGFIRIDLSAVDDPGQRRQPARSGHRRSPWRIRLASRSRPCTSRRLLARQLAGTRRWQHVQPGRGGHPQPPGLGGPAQRPRRGRRRCRSAWFALLGPGRGGPDRAGRVDGQADPAAGRAARIVAGAACTTCTSWPGSTPSGTC